MEEESVQVKCMAFCWLDYEILLVISRSHRISSDALLFLHNLPSIPILFSLYSNIPFGRQARFAMSAYVSLCLFFGNVFSQ